MPFGTGRNEHGGTRLPGSRRVGQERREPPVYCELLTATVAGSRSAPGPGRPVVTLMSVGVGVGDAEGGRVDEASVRPYPDEPVRVMLPPPLVGKHGVARVARAAELRDAALGVDAVALGVGGRRRPRRCSPRCRCRRRRRRPASGDPRSPGRAAGPTIGVAAPVVNGSLMSSAVGGPSRRAACRRWTGGRGPCRRPSPRRRRGSRRPAFFAVFEHLPTLPMPPPPPATLQRGHTSGNVVRR